MVEQDTEGQTLGQPITVEEPDVSSGFECLQELPALELSLI